MKFILLVILVRVLLELADGAASKRVAKKPPTR